ncbi:MAG: hypothetical protein KC589_06255 [Nanoarchaeota archaeon]|nr:hypothetical protein [Nanoarchaeota archaeon]
MAKIKIKNEAWSVILTLGVIIFLLFMGGVSAINFSLEKGINSSEVYEREILPLDLSIKINENERIEINNYSLSIYSSGVDLNQSCIFDKYGDKIDCSEFFKDVIFSPENQYIENENISNNETFGYNKGDINFRLNFLVPEMNDKNSREFNVDVVANSDTQTYGKEKFLSFIVKNKPYGEDFELSNLSGSSYTSNSFIGNDWIRWNFTDARKSGTYNINETSLILRGNEYNSSLISEEIQGGIEYLSFDYKKAFTSTEMRKIEVYINGIQIGNITEFNDDEIHKFSIYNLNISDNFNIEIRNVGSKQVIIDNLEWDN